MNSKIIAFAISAHQSVNHYYDGGPYSVHLSMVALNCQRFLHLIPESYKRIVMDACWLHDTIEDCRLTYNDVRKVSSTEVANIVYAVSNEKGKTREERANDKYYQGINTVRFADFVKLCDRLANIQYSLQNSSRMYDIYKEENKSFLLKLLPLDTSKILYQEIIDEINILLK